MSINDVKAAKYFIDNADNHAEALRVVFHELVSKDWEYAPVLMNTALCILNETLMAMKKEIDLGHVGVCYTASAISEGYPKRNMNMQVVCGLDPLMRFQFPKGADSASASEKELFNVYRRAVRLWVKKDEIGYVRWAKCLSDLEWIRKYVLP